jgi:hypothetical protein
MVALAAERADALLLSMLSADDAHAVARAVRSASGHAVSYTYHRVALDPGARERVHHEMVSHGAWPADGTMPSERELLGTVLPSRAGIHDRIDTDLAAYPDDWLPVLRPLPRAPSELDEWRELFQLLAPGE